MPSLLMWRVSGSSRQGSAWNGQGGRQSHVLQANCVPGKEVDGHVDRHMVDSEESLQALKDTGLILLI